MPTFNPFMLKSLFIYLMMLLFGVSSVNGQLIGADLFTSFISSDSLKIQTNLYHYCGKEPKLNDTLSLKIKYGTLDTGRFYALPTQIKVDSTLGCFSCACEDRKCQNKRIIKIETVYTIKLADFGLPNICELFAFYTPGFRDSSFTSFDSADGSLISLSCYANLCALGRQTREYNFALDPEFIALKDQPYIHSQGFVPKIGGLRNVDSINVRKVVPSSALNRSLTYATGFNLNSPLHYTAYPNSSRTFPRGFHVYERTGDIRFYPTQEEKTIISTQFDTYLKGALITTSHREFSLKIIESIAAKNVIISGKNYSSNGNINNYTLLQCSSDSIKYGFEIENSNTPTYHQRLIEIDPFLSRYISAKQKGVDTFQIKLNFGHNEGGKHALRFLVKVRDSSCLSGWSSSYTFLVFRNNPPNTSTIIKSKGNEVILHAQNHDGNTVKKYKWFFNGKIYHTGDTTISMNRPSDYPYRLISYGQVGCNDTIKGRFTTGNFPYAEIIFSKDKACYGDTLTLKAISYNISTAVEYRWNAGHIGGQLNLEFSKDTMVILKATFADSSSSYDTLVINGLESPKPSIRALSSIHCQGNELSLVCAHDSAEIDSINPVIWFARGQNIGRGDTIRIRGEQKITARASYQNGCLATTSFPVKFTKFSGLENYHASICMGDSFRFSLPKSGKNHHDWFKNGQLIKQGARSFLWPKAQKGDTFLVETTYADSLSNCLISDTISFDLKTLPSFFLQADSIFCANDSAIHIQTDSFIYPSYGIWTEKDASTLDENGFFHPEKLAPQMENYPIQYALTDPISGCSYSRKVLFTVLPVSPPEFLEDSIKLCIGGNNLLLNSTSLAIPANGVWTGNGVINTESKYYFSPSLVGVNSTNSLTYLLESPNGCVFKSSLLATVNLKPNPYAKVRSSYAPRSIDFYANRDSNDCEVDKWFWDFYDFKSPNCTLDAVVDSVEELYCRYAIVENPVHRYQSSGIYPVKLVVEDSKTGVKDSVTKSNYIFLLATSLPENPVSGIAIYPNPCRDKVTLSQDVHLPVTGYRIFDLMGREIISAQVHKEETIIDLTKIENQLVVIALIGKAGQVISTQSLSILGK